MLACVHYIINCIPQNKTIVKPDEHISQGIEEQCDDSFVLANIEEVTHENDVPEYEQTRQATIVSLDDTKPTLGYASEEDVEVDIDGSDIEEECNNLIPGTRSYPVKLHCFHSRFLHGTRALL